MSGSAISKILLFLVAFLAFSISFRKALKESSNKFSDSSGNVSIKTNDLPKEFMFALHELSFQIANMLHVPSKNLVFSPSSILYALGMLFEGTAGRSRQEIATSLFNIDYSKPKADDGVAGAFASLAKLFRGHPDGMQKLLRIANLFYVQKNFKLRKDFVKSLKDKYQAVGQGVDFYKANTEALKTINNDVKKATKGMIPNMLDSIESNTATILINVMHFKGEWKERFDPKDTDMDSEFNLSNGEKIKVPMMMHTSNVYRENWCSKTGVRIVLVPYTSGTGNEQIYMAIITPEERDIRNHSSAQTIKQYWDSFDAEHFNRLIDDSTIQRQFHLELPRFKIVSTHKLVSTLKNLGITSVFDESSANLSKISEDKLFVSDVIQKAAIEINEEGTEASAATAVRLTLKSAGNAFYADKPFVYALITENQNHYRSIHFVGVVENPLEI